MIYTPKGNIPVVGPFMLQNGLLLDHPSPPYDLRKYNPFYYFNPHNPPPGGHNQVLHANNRMGYLPNNASRWTNSQVSSKSVEVHRVDEVFKKADLGGDQLQETEAGTNTINLYVLHSLTNFISAPEIATNLYPHQKKALTFLLERERETSDPDGNSSSLWQRHQKGMTGQDFWLHAITEKESFEEPQETKGAILADDVCCCIFPFSISTNSNLSL